MKRNFEDLSSLQPSPRVGAAGGPPYTTNQYLSLEEYPPGAAADNHPKPRGSLKDVLDSQLGLKGTKQNEDINLNLTKNDCSIASSLPELIDATQILRRQTNDFRLNQLDSSQAAIGPFLQDSQNKFREPEGNPNTSLCQMSPRGSLAHGYPGSSKKYVSGDRSSLYPYAAPRPPTGQHYKSQLQPPEGGTTQSNGQRLAPSAPQHGRQQPGIPGSQTMMESPGNAGHYNFSAMQSQSLNRLLSDMVRDERDARKDPLHSERGIRAEGNADAASAVGEASGLRTQRQPQHGRERTQDVGQNQHAAPEPQRPQAYQRAALNPSDPSENSESLRQREHQSRVVRDFEREAYRKHHQNELSYSELEQLRHQLLSTSQKKGHEYGLGQRDYPEMGSYGQAGGYPRAPGPGLHVSQALQRFMAQQPMLARGGHESLSKYTENHNVEFETVSSHSNTHTAKMLNRSRQPIAMQPRGENHEASMAAPLSYANSRGYLPNSNLNSSMHEASRLSNSQTMRVRPALASNPPAPQKQPSRGHAFVGDGQ